MNGQEYLNSGENADLSVFEKLKHRQIERIPASSKKDAAVLIPVLQGENGPEILFEIRSSKVTQGGEICFPGGRIETGEEAAQTAVREAAEELQIVRRNIETPVPMHLLTTHFDVLVYSYAALIRDYQGTFSKREVRSVFSIPLRELLSAEPEVYHGSLERRLPKDFPYDLIPGGREYHWSSLQRDYWFYRTEHGAIWGLTGEILYHFLETVRNTEC